MRRTAAAAVLLMLTACTTRPDGVDGKPETRPADSEVRGESSSSQQTELLAAPKGKRWVGITGVMVAVPRQWRTVAGQCGEPVGDVVQFPGHRRTSLCSDLPTRGVSSLVVAPMDSGVIALGRRADLGAEANGLPVTHSGVMCGYGRGCTYTVGVSSANAAFELSYPRQHPPRFMSGLIESFRRIPRGATAVPLIDLGVPVSRAKKQLEAVGLNAESPAVDFPHYATGTSPAVGSVVPRGSTVMLTIGDG